MYLKSVVLVSREAPPIPIVGAVEPKAVVFDTSTMLENTFKALPSHFKFKQTFCFFAFYFILFYFMRQSLGIEPHPRYQNPAGYVAASVTKNERNRRNDKKIMLVIFLKRL